MMQGLDVIYWRLLERQQAIDDKGRRQRMVETAGALLEAFRGRCESLLFLLLIEVAVFIGFNQNRYRYFLNGLAHHEVLMRIESPVSCCKQNFS